MKQKLSVVFHSVPSYSPPPRFLKFSKLNFSTSNIWHFSLNTYHTFPPKWRASRPNMLLSIFTIWRTPPHLTPPNHPRVKALQAVYTAALLATQCVTCLSKNITHPFHIKTDTSFTWQNVTIQHVTCVSMSHSHHTTSSKSGASWHKNQEPHIQIVLLLKFCRIHRNRFQKKSFRRRTNFRSSLRWSRPMTSWCTFASFISSFVGLAEDYISVFFAESPAPCSRSST